MTKAKLIVWIDWDPDGTGIGAELPGPDAMEFDIEVTDPDQKYTIEITAAGVTMNSPVEPKLVTTEAMYDAWTEKASDLIKDAREHVQLLDPDTSTEEET